MKKILLSGFLLVTISVQAQQKNNRSVIVRDSPFDDNWLFTKDDVANAEQTTYDNATWRKIDLPHDWSIEDLPNQIPDSVVGPFSKAAISKQAVGYTIGGTAWYRKHFTLNNTSTSKETYIQFDGVYMNADVWINGIT